MYIILEVVEFIFRQTFCMMEWLLKKKQVMTQIQTHFLFHRLCHVSLPAPSRTPCCFYPRCVHVFTSAFPFSSPLWRLVFAARNYPENVLKRCPTSLHILWRTFIDRRHFSWRTSRLPRRWTLHPSSYSSLPTLRSLYGWQGLKYKYTHYLPLNHLCAPLPSSQHPNLLKWLTSWWELAAPTDSVPTLSELPLRYPDIPPLPEGLGVSRILIRGPWCKQIIYNIPEINRAKEKSCFHLVLRSIFFEPITLPLQYHAFQMCLLWSLAFGFFADPCLFFSSRTTTSLSHLVHGYFWMGCGGWCCSISQKLVFAGLDVWISHFDHIMMQSFNTMQ